MEAERSPNSDMAGSCRLTGSFEMNSPTDIDDVAISPQDICPLLVGNRVPAAILTTSGGKPYDLTAALAQQRTVLIVYRGGW